MPQLTSFHDGEVNEAFSFKGPSHQLLMEIDYLQENGSEEPLSRVLPHHILATLSSSPVEVSERENILKVTQGHAPFTDPLFSFGFPSLIPSLSTLLRCHKRVALRTVWL